MKASTLFSVGMLSASAQATFSATWTACTNAPHCISTTAPWGNSKDEPYTYGDITLYAGAAIFPYQATSTFTYSETDGYWYSHDTDGEFISPKGYMKFAHGYNIIGIESKDSSIGSSFWLHHAEPCCLPDQIGKNIYNVFSYDVGWT